MNSLWQRVRPLFSNSVRYMHISYLEAKSNYEGTVLGILWMPASTLIFTALLGLVFRNPGTHTPVDFFLYVLSGYSVWNFISGSITGSTNLIQSKLDFAVHNNLSLPGLFAKNVGDLFFEFGLNIALLVLALTVLAPGNFGWPLLLFVPLVALLGGTSIAVSYVVNLTTIYFPDLANVVKTGVRFLFFATPVFWAAEDRGGVRAALEHYNPASYFLHVTRQAFGIEPLNGEVWAVAAGLGAAACLIAAVAYRQTNAFVRNLK
jgi:ABC-type polysaccharide/polyol phosphate export permease